MRSVLNRRTVLHGALGAGRGRGRASRVRAGASRSRTTCRCSTGVGGNVVGAQDDRRRRARRQRHGAARTTACSSFVEAATGSRRVHTLFNTHWHLDQVGGNEALGNAGANIVAHEKTRLRLASAYYLPERDAYQPPMPVQAQPTESFYTTGSTTIGGKRIEYGYLLEAHTDGDAYVYFRDDNVIAVGDAIAPERDVELDWWGGGWLGGRVDSLKQLLDAHGRANALRAKLRRAGRPRRGASRARHVRACCSSASSSASARARPTRTCSQPASWKARGGRGTTRPSSCTTRTRASGATTTLCRTISYETPDARSVRFCLPAPRRTRRRPLADLIQNGERAAALALIDERRRRQRNSRRRHDAAALGCLQSRPRARRRAARARRQSRRHEQVRLEPARRSREARRRRDWSSNCSMPEPTSNRRTATARRH